MSGRPIKLVVWITPAGLRWGLAGALLLIAAYEIGTESFTLVTTYPAPSGIYNKMITTGDTYLARDSGGKVGIGTTNAREALEVNGDIMLSTDTATNLQHRIRNVGIPLKGDDVATKAYVDAASGGQGGFSNFVAFNTNGTYNWPVPAGVTKLVVELCGGGGGGGSSCGQNHAVSANVPCAGGGGAGGSGASGGWYSGAGGGAGGAYGKGQITIPPGTTSLTITVGKGGAGGVGWGAAGAAGGVSQISGGSPTILANGGGGGVTGSYSPSGGTGGTSTAPLGIVGTPGVPGQTASPYNGGNGGASFFTFYATAGAGTGGAGAACNMNTYGGSGADGIVILSY